LDVERRWLEFPVKNRKDFREMTRRYDPRSQGRISENWEELKARYRNRDFVLGFSIPSLFWRVRDWVGFEGLCIMFYEDPMGELEKALGPIEEMWNVEKAWAVPDEEEETGP